MELSEIWSPERAAFSLAARSAVFLSLDLPFISKHHATRAVNQTTKRPRFFDSFLWFASPLQRILHIVKKPFRNDGRMLAFVYLTQVAKMTIIKRIRQHSLYTIFMKWLFASRLLAK